MSKLWIMLMMCCVLGGSALAVIPYTDDFDEAPGTDPTAAGYWDEVTGTNGDYTGTGHYNISSAYSTEIPGLSTTIGSGDFTAELSLDNYVAALGPFVDGVDYDYTLFEFRISDATQYVSVQVVAWWGDLYLKMLYYSPTLAFWYGPQPIICSPTELNSLDIRVNWIDDPTQAGGFWDIDYNLNDTGWVDGAEMMPGDADVNGGGGYNEDASDTRTLEFFGFGYTDGGLSYATLSELSVDVDYYAMTPIYRWNATNPNPADGAAASSGDVVLSWETGTNSPEPIVEHRVYFGTDPNFIGEDPAAVYPVETTTHLVEDVISGTVYYWRVDEVIADSNSEIGKVWSFIVDPLYVTPESVRMDAGGTAEFVATYSGGTADSYQWYRNGVALNGENSSVLSIDSVGSADHGRYYCEVISGTDTVKSNTVMLRVNHLVGYWDFESGLDDVTVHGSDLKVVAGAVEYGIGLFDEGAALSLDGSTAVAADPNSEPLFDIYDTLTVSCWIKPNSVNNFDFFFAKGGLYNGWFLGWYYIYDLANFRTFVDDGYYELYGTTNLYDGQWHHIVGVFDNGAQRIHIDGVLENEVERGPVMIANDEWLTIGGVLSNDAYAYFYDGLIDDVRIYNYAMSAKEAAIEYATVTGTSVCAVRPQFDVNDDCRVGLGDLAVFAATWTECGLVPDCLDSE